MPDDVYGEIFNRRQLERAAAVTLNAWLSAHLAVQERQEGLDPATLKPIASWWTVEEFDLEAHKKLPAIVIVSPGTTGKVERNGRGELSAWWAVQVVAAVPGKHETEVRDLSPLYSAAVRGAFLQGGRAPEPANGIGTVAQRVRWTGEDSAFGATRNHAQRALEENSFEVLIPNVLTDLGGPDVPPPDPHGPPLEPLEIADARLDVNRST